MRRRGQYSLVEQVILFAAGISIAFGFMIAFRSLGDNVQTTAAEGQTELVGRFMASTMVELAESGAEGSIRIDTPNSIAGQAYAVTLDNGSIAVVTGGSQRDVGAYGLLSRYRHGGRFDSTDTEARIKFEDAQLLLEAD